MRPTIVFVFGLYKNSRNVCFGGIKLVVWKCSNASIVSAPWFTILFLFSPCYCFIPFGQFFPFSIWFKVNFSSKVYNINFKSASQTKWQNVRARTNHTTTLFRLYLFRWPKKRFRLWNKSAKRSHNARSRIALNGNCYYIRWYSIMRSVGMRGLLSSFVIHYYVSFDSFLCSAFLWWWDQMCVCECVCVSPLQYNDKQCILATLSTWTSHTINRDQFKSRAKKISSIELIHLNDKSDYTVTVYQAKAGISYVVCTAKHGHWLRS